MGELKAISTLYKSHKFRSRLEARWAVFYDALDIKWEYEKEGYELPSGRYLPDFWLPEQEYWVEIKGKEPTEKEKQLAIELSLTTNHLTFIFYGPIPKAPDRFNDLRWGDNYYYHTAPRSPYLCFYTIRCGVKTGHCFHDEFDWCYDDFCGAAAISRNGDASWACKCDGLGRKELGSCHKWQNGLKQAYDKARQFDFGRDDE